MANRYENIEWFLVSKNGVIRAFNEGYVPERMTDFDLGRSEAKLVTSKDTLDLLSYEVLGDSLNWSTIGDINWPLVEDPLECPDNVEIIIPSKDQVL